MVSSSEYKGNKFNTLTSLKQFSVINPSIPFKAKLYHTMKYSSVPLEMLWIKESMTTTTTTTDDFIHALSKQIVGNAGIYKEH